MDVGCSRKHIKPGIKIGVLLPTGCVTLLSISASLRLSVCTYKQSHLSGIEWDTCVYIYFLSLSLSWAMYLLFMAVSSRHGT